MITYLVPRNISHEWRLLSVKGMEGETDMSQMLGMCNSVSWTWALSSARANGRVHLVSA